MLFMFQAASASFAQDSLALKFVDGHELKLSGRAFNSNQNYHRLDSSDRKLLIPRVKELATNSAGLSISFTTDAKTISLQWRLARWLDQWNMTPLAVNGLDLYGLKDGKWSYVASARPTGLNNSAVLVKNLDGQMRDYRLYLPLYTEISEVGVGVPTNATINKSAPPANQKRVVIYGSSITQGASASRPGMAYPSIMARSQNIEVINLGFSGSGTMETEIVDVLAKIPADVYILDCVANPSPQMIKDRAYGFVKKLRTLRPNTPIIMVESIFRETGNWDSQIGARTTQQNMEFRNAYQRAMGDSDKNLHYIFSKDLIGNDHEATIDGTHLTDVGFMRLAEAIGEEVKKVIGK